MQKWLRTSMGLLGGFTTLAAGYLAYLWLSYHRLSDDLPLAIKPGKAAPPLTTGKQYTAMTYNIGYGSYPPRYSFFMSGGRYARAYSATSVKHSLAGVIHTVNKVAPDFAMYQEVDLKGDRSRHVNELALLDAGMPQAFRVFGQNYDSAYLFYPFTQPIGAAKSGLVTQARHSVIAARRFSLPVDNDHNKLMDLDRAFTVVHSPVDNGHELVVINVHLSAFTPNQALRAAQLTKLFTYIHKCAEQGDYVLVAGDFNHRLIADAPEVFHTDAHTRTWTHRFPVAQLPAGFYQPTMGLREAGEPSVRALDRPYVPGQSFVSLIDGFICSPNIEALAVQVVATGFKDSDHQPVKLTFTLN